MCRIRAQGELRYTAWLFDQDVERLDPGESWLCPTHLFDASVLDEQATQQVAEAMRRNLLGRLSRLNGQVRNTNDRRQLRVRLQAAWPHLHRRQSDKVSAALRHPRTQVTKSMRNFQRGESSCAACAAGEVARRREFALLRAALSHQTVRDHWERGHGLCVEHAPVLRPDALPEQVLHSRLNLLAWELEETRRKIAVAVQPWWRDYAAAAMSGVRAGGSHAPVVNRRVIASRVSRPHLVAVDR